MFAAGPEYVERLAVAHFPIWMKSNRVPYATLYLAFIFEPWTGLRQ
jgi:hypothetical protein